MKCTQCQTEARPLGPTNKIQKEKLIFGCPKCGYVFRANGEGIKLPTGKGVPGLSSLSDAISSAMDSVFKDQGKSINPNEAAVIQAVLSDLYVEAFSSGVKQGLLLGTIQNRYNNKEKT